jgi:glycosyltransferase involved in cell wall biosynthesis
MELTGMKKENLISVIVPVYNMENYLEKCLDSITGQSYRNLEIILVDDASKDNSGKICDRYAAKDGRIKVIHRAKNGGLSAARNSGLDIATGDYLGFADSDDWLEKDMYQFLLDNLLQVNADISLCGFSRIFDDFELPNDKSYSYRVLRGEDALALLLQDRIIQNFYWCKLYKKDLLNGIRMPEGKIFEDIFTQHLIFEKAQKVVLHNVPKYNYQQRSSSVSNTGDWNDDYLEAFYERVRYFSKKGEKHFSRLSAITYLDALNNLYNLNSSDKQIRAELRERYAAFFRHDDNSCLLRRWEKFFYDSAYSGPPLISRVYRKCRNIRMVIKDEGLRGFYQRTLSKINL